MSLTHECDERKNENIIFYSPLWKSWALKIIPANYQIAKDHGVNLPVVIIAELKFCLYCGVKL